MPQSRKEILSFVLAERRHEKTTSIYHITLGKQIYRRRLKFNDFSIMTTVSKKILAVHKFIIS